MTQPVVTTHELTKTYSTGLGWKTHLALRDVSVSLSPSCIVGLVGRNGSGKTTLIKSIAGLELPTKGSCRTLGVEAKDLEPKELRRIGLVQQETRLLGWMLISEQVRYVASFYDTWDSDLEQCLYEELNLDPKAVIRTLPPGKLQSLAILLAVCHRPELLLLDEPVSFLDPIVRVAALRLFKRLLREDGCTILISSHVLNDVESVIDHLLCLHEGELIEDRSLDDLKESYAEWRFATNLGSLPNLDRSFVLSRETKGGQVRLVVREEESEEFRLFRQQLGSSAARRPLNLEQVFPYLLPGDER